jgi:ubiquinone/menaquinone biosynthesis C-methylase UbiE
MSMTGITRDFDAEATTWDENPVRVQMSRDVAEAIRETIPLMPDMDVLDFGCGTGLVALRLRPSVRSVTGVDSSQGMVDILTAKVRRQGLKNVTALHADPDKGGVPGGQYDCVVCCMMLHHVPDIQPLLDRFAGVLRPAGLLAVADLDPDEGKFHESNAGVFHSGFDRCAMQEHFGRAGFENVRNRTAAILPGMAKPVPGESTRMFTVFLMTGQKRGRPGEGAGKTPPKLKNPG